MTEINCEECKYFDKEEENCTYIACDGLDCDDAPCGFRELEDYFKYEVGDADGEIIINGKSYKYELTLNPFAPDHKCCRVFMDGNYYYFG